MSARHQLTPPWPCLTSRMMWFIFMAKFKLPTRYITAGKMHEMPNQRIVSQIRIHHQSANHPKFSQHAWLFMAVPYLLDREMFLIPGIDWTPGLWVLQSPYWGLIAVCIIAAVAFHRPSHDDSAVLRAFDIASGIVMAIGVLLVLGQVLGPIPWVIQVGLSLCGAGTAWQYIRWSQWLTNLTLRDAVVHVCDAFVVAGLLKCVLFLLLSIRVAVDVSLAIAATIGLRACIASSFVPNASMRRPLQVEPIHLRDFSLVPVTVTLICCTLGVMYAARYQTFGASQGIQIVLGYALEVIAAFAVWFWVSVAKKSFDLVGILAAMATTVATSTTLLATLGNSASGLAFFLTSVNYCLLNLFLWVLLLAISGKVSYDPRVVFALGWLIRSAPFLLGGVIAKSTQLKLDPAVCAVLMYIACMALVTTVLGRNTTTSAIFSKLAPEAPTNRAGLEQRCQELVRTYKLTAREAEVLKLLASGRTRPYVAEALSISENTVRVYSSKIYTKLGIHDKGSLFALVYGTSEADNTPE